MKITKCETCRLKHIDEKCPRCNPPAAPKIDMEAFYNRQAVSIAQMTDTQVKYIFNNSLWEQGNKKTREQCLAEYDKRFGLENWPSHIEKE